MKYKCDVIKFGYCGTADVNLTKRQQQLQYNVHVDLKLPFTVSVTKYCTVGSHFKREPLNFTVNCENVLFVIFWDNVYGAKNRHVIQITMICLYIYLLLMLLNTAIPIYL